MTINIDTVPTVCYDDSVGYWFRLPLRTRLGIIGSVSLVCVIVLILLWYQNLVQFAPHRFAGILCLGILVFLLWLAWGDIEKIPRWNWLIIFVMLLISSIKPGFWFVAIPVTVYLLMQRKK